ncbi:MAG: 2-hydroxyacyl-CoA dehydratase, partial [Firmicutes bacterium]|nr:2-hydroxyacyl-CoA dehydratase [Bacillota bacterium]
MEIIKDLPKVFEEFGEQRKNSFLAIKKVKETGIPVVGCYCTYLPKEIVMAAGGATVGLCSTSDETIGEAEKDLPKNLCPLIKSSYGFAKTDKCPFFYFSDVVVGETTCDGKKKMYEIMSEIKDVYLIQLPQIQNERGIAYYKEELIRFSKYLEEKFETTITEEKLREAIRVNNEIYKAMQKLGDVMKHEPAPITGGNLFKVFYGSGFKFDRTVIADELNAIADKIET